MIFPKPVVLYTSVNNPGAAALVAELAHKFDNLTGNAVFVEDS